MKTEDTQPGNPHKLVKKQHVFPVTAIRRFADSQGRVQVRRVAGGKQLRLDARHEIFCANRAWDQSAETWRYRGIEVDYAALADAILAAEVIHLDAKMEKSVLDFYLLWNMRFMAKKSPPLDTKIAGESEARDKDHEELLEAGGMMFFRGNELPQRFIESIQILRNMDLARPSFHGTRWKVVEATAGEFLVPDNAHRVPVVPLSPTLCILNVDGDDDASPVKFDLEGVRKTNRQLLASVVDYYFARDLERCPI